MSYVPIIVTHSASARAEDLAKRLEQILDDYRRQHPSTSDRDVLQALELINRRQATGTTAARIALALGLMLGVLGLFFFTQSAGQEWGGSVFGSGSFRIVAIGALILILAVVFGLKGGLSDGEKRPTMLIVSGVVLLLFLALASIFFLAYRS